MVHAKQETPTGWFHPHQGNAPGRCCLQIKGAAAELPEQFSECSLGIVVTAKIITLHGYRHGFHHPLLGATMFPMSKRRAQRLMPLDESGEGRRQRLFIQLAPQIQAARKMVGTALRFQLGQEPEPLLGKGLRCQLTPVLGAQ